jgi:hypothetical protein
MPDRRYFEELTLGNKTSPEQQAAREEDRKNNPDRPQPRQPPTDAFMDDLFNNGWMPETEMMFLKSGKVDPWHPGAGTYATKGFEKNPASMDFYGRMHQWLRKQELGADYQGLMHPKLRGEPGPAPKK